MQVAKPTKMNEVAKRLSNCMGATRFARSAKSAIVMAVEEFHQKILLLLELKVG